MIVICFYFGLQSMCYIIAQQAYTCIKILFINLYIKSKTIFKIKILIIFKSSSKPMTTKNCYFLSSVFYPFEVFLWPSIRYTYSVYINYNIN